MKKILAYAAATATALTVVSGAALATDPVSSDLTITGTVRSLASLPTPTSTGGSNASLSGNIVSITELATQDLVPNANTNIAISYGNVTTNYKAKVGLYSLNGGLKTSGAASTGFANMIRYNAAAVIAGATINGVAASQPVANLATSATNRTVLSSVLDSFSSKDIVVTVDGLHTDTPDAKLVQGEYTDTLTVKLGSDL